MPLPPEVLNNSFESKVSMKVEANSRGFNTSVHCYAGVTKKEIDKTVQMTIYAHLSLQAALNTKQDIDVKLAAEVQELA